MTVVYENEKNARKLAKKLGVQVQHLEEREDGRYVVITFDNGYKVRGYSFDIFVFNTGVMTRLIKRNMAAYLARKTAVIHE